MLPKFNAPPSLLGNEKKNSSGFSVLMGTQKLSSLALLKTHFDSADKVFSEEFLRGTMLRIANSFWVFACKFLLFLFGFMLRFRFRLEKDDCSQKNDFNSKGEDQIASDGSGQKEIAPAELFSGFQFQNSETEDSVLSEASASLTPSTSKYQVVSCKGFSGFMEEPETLSFTVKELFMGSNDAPVINTVNEDHKGFRELHSEEVQELAVCSQGISVGDDQIINLVSSEEDLEGFNSEEEISFLGKTEEDPEEFNSETEEIIPAKTEDSVLEKADQVNSTEYDLFVNEEMVSFEPYHSRWIDLVDEAGLLSENRFSPSHSEPKSVNSSIEEVSIDGHKVDPVATEYNYMDEEMEETDVLTPGYEKRIEFHPNSEDINRDKEEDGDGFIELEPNLQSSSHLDEELHVKELRGRADTKHEQENLHFTETEPIDSLGKYEEPISSQRKSWEFDPEEEEEEDDEFDILLKHKDLVEQMKMEMKNARIKGLPTILEECESPKLAEDLKPLKIDEKFEHKDCMEEIQKVYKSYAEKMRKLDILNYQTQHAISFLQLKDPVLQQASGQKSSVSAAIKSVLFPNLWPCNLRRIYADPALKSVTELHRNLEMVYVGQVCLSWEILHWQYEKAKELLEHDHDDSNGHRPYDQVADEFQQFQVLVQRFVENEPFQGPRVQNYAKNRCELRTLLQVPAIKEDCLKDKKDGRAAEEESAVVPITRLAETIDESMRVFWEFLRADKEDANVTMKGLQATNFDVQDHSDSELLTDIKMSLQKKEKRVKDILRSGNCIVKKFQKHQDVRLDHELLYAQVELKLVSRVLSMSRVTADQLGWCQKKLNKINICNRKIHVEPSFLLFPI